MVPSAQADPFPCDRVVRLQLFRKDSVLVEDELELNVLLTVVEAFAFIPVWYFVRHLHRAWTMSACDTTTVSVTIHKHSRHPDEAVERATWTGCRVYNRRFLLRVTDD